MHPSSQATDEIQAALQTVAQLDDSDLSAHASAFETLHRALADRLAQAED